MVGRSYMTPRTQRLPRPVRTVLQDFIACLALRAALVTEGAVPKSPFDRRVAQTLQFLRDRAPARAWSVQERLRAPLAHDAYRHDRRFRGWHGLALVPEALGVIQPERLDERARPRLQKWVAAAELGGQPPPLARTYAHWNHPFRFVKLFLRSVEIARPHQDLADLNVDVLHLNSYSVDGRGRLGKSRLEIGSFDDQDYRQFSGPGRLIREFDLDDPFPRKHGLSFSVFAGNQEQICALSDALIDEAQLLLGGALEHWMDLPDGLFQGGTSPDAWAERAPILAPLVTTGMAAITRWIVGWLGDDYLASAALDIHIEDNRSGWRDSGAPRSRALPVAFRSRDLEMTAELVAYMEP